MFSPLSPHSLHPAPEPLPWLPKSTLNFKARRIISSDRPREIMLLSQNTLFAKQ
ncbi:hypothetical protein [Fischerella sp. PCC 9605]|uniref:hypothetical protein n=1 Tax=Fischerella sp. PCC 9605 TaxID=1173024 RepID=UPI0004AF41FD|nr:hypothetical protein [Fischerella sp. PCC 9605]